MLQPRLNYARAAISSHLVEEICTRVLIMKRGRRVTLGTIEEILTERPDLRGRSLEDIFLTLTGA